MVADLAFDARLDAELSRAWAELTAPGERYEIGTVQVRGDALRCYLQAPETVAAFWAESAAAFAERDYLVWSDERISYDRAYRMSASVAAWLVERGVKSGDRVAIAMRNYPEWLVIYWACLSIGVVAVGMNAWWVAQEMAYALEDAEPKVIFCDDERLTRLNRCLQRSRDMHVVAVRTDSVPNGCVPWRSVLGTRSEMPKAHINPDDDACIFYTSGTTGKPKGAQLTHRGCIANLMNVGFAIEVHALAQARARGQPYRQAQRPVALITTPLFHVTANNCSAYPVTAAGGALVLMRRWDAGEALRLIEQERVTSMGGVPTMGRELIRHPNAHVLKASSLQTISGGGAQVPPDLVTEIEALGGQAEPSTGYGMTETCGIIAAVAGDCYVSRLNSCGRLLPAYEAKLVDEVGEEVEPGSAGELCVRGTSVIKCVFQPIVDAVSV